MSGDPICPEHGGSVKLCYIRHAESCTFTCPVCKMTSHNPNDVEWGYCGNCHAYTGVVNPLMKAKRFVAETRRVENLDLGDDPDGDIEGYDGA